MPARHASKQKNDGLLFYLLLSAMLAVGLLNIIVYLSQKGRVITIDTSRDEYSFWKKVVNDYPTYEDGQRVLSGFTEKK